MSRLRRKPASATSEEAIWQDVEFGDFVADLPLWEELAAQADGPVLELGAGSGRVALHLAKRGSMVYALDRDAGMLEELATRGADLPLLVPLPGDLSRPEGTWLDLGSPPGLAIAPLHMLQQIDPHARPALLATLADLLPTGARAAFVLVDEASLVADGIEEQPEVPDIREVGGWVYSSEPLWVQVGEGTVTARRLRQRVSPAGELERSIHDDVLHRLSPDLLEREGADAGLRAVGRRPISSGPAEADSVAVILEAP